MSAVWPTSQSICLPPGPLLSGMKLSASSAPPASQASNITAGDKRSSHISQERREGLVVVDILRFSCVSICTSFLASGDCAPLLALLLSPAGSTTYAFMLTL